MLIVTGEHWSIVPTKEVENNWKLTEFHYEIKDGVVHIYTHGAHGDLAVKYHTRIDENGTIIIDYLVSHAPEGKNIQEAGIKFLVGSNFNKMAWDRKAYWTAYPQLHMGMPEGELDLSHHPKTEYRKFPQHPWELDTKNFYYHGLDKTLPLTNIARALKENIYRYSLTNPDKSQIEILANADKACRLDKTDAGFELHILQQWDYNSLRWGNYQKNVKFPPEYQNTVFLKISCP
jgi:beta-galactosidase